MLTITNHTLEKLETLLRDLEYKVRYEKGNFKSGACLLQETKVVVVNKFITLEQKINALAEIIKQVPADESLLDDKQKAFYLNLKQMELEL
ncbi:hypothetical protein [Solitalea koreensis]|uniref:Uncharacterized protein n=1 Tax=Solitalea koreensis TaxID=543615 RepID=A0A521DPP0_9SPHI|nr:hypothetical protein [Solitalea koreensis]SMO73674.1 hypothetical protein SAMN06265350_10831 [Solitalea koreensis]